jgi:pimeloyl-ACP methyl ester carboxylesterase
VAEVAGMVEARGIDDAVLVGFSYGGVVIAGVAEALPERVAELVFVDAFVPVPGRSLFDLFPPAVRAAFEATAEDGWRLAPAPIAAVGGIGAVESGVDTERVLSLLQRRGQHPIGTYRQPLDQPFQRAADVPRRYISCTDKPDGDPMMATAARLRAAGWAVEDLPTGHFAMLTMPARLTELLTAAH